MCIIANSLDLMKPFSSGKKIFHLWLLKSIENWDQYITIMRLHFSHVLILVRDGKSRQLGWGGGQN